MTDQPQDLTPKPETAAPPGAKPAFGRAQGRSERPPQSPKRRRRPRTWGLILIAVLVVMSTAGLGAAWEVGRLLEGVPDIPDKSALVVVNEAPGMTFEDSAGRVIATRGPRHGHPVRLAELPPYVPHAFLAAEDRRFYKHGAVDPRGISRALMVNWRARRTVQGGSTLTQQLAKTLYLKPDQTLTRKFQEAVIAYRIEQAMSKDEVLELYLNRIFFGDNAYGVDAAAQTYFGKPASQLTLQEAALLAALPKAPTRLALTNDMPAALRRSRLVLENMRAEGWISPQDEDAALAAPPKLAPEAPGEGDYGYVLDMAAAQAVQIAGGAAPDLVVRLTIDPSLQATAQSVVREAIAQNGRRAGVSQGALVLLAPDGAIRALVGGTDHHASAFNRATQAQRQPGSSFKPFVYAAALEAGVKPTDIRQDAPIRIGLWSPSNFGGGYRGPVTVADALAHSLNSVAVRLANEVGRDKLGEIAHRFGLASIPASPDLSIALGAYEVNLLELTAGYQVFQTGGLRNQTYLIQDITTTRGDTLFAHVPSAGIGVYDPFHADQMVKMLEGVVLEGTGTRAAFGRPAAGKTGTSQNSRDAWFVGFTPDWVCGVWVGNDDATPMNNVTGGAIPAEIWRRMMVVAHANLEPHDFAWMAAAEASAPADADADAPPPPDAATASDNPPEPEQPEPDRRAGFYDSLSHDFDRAAQDPAAPPRADSPPDDPDAPPRRDPAPDPNP
ncbi:MAG TPA: PBP1A family penicillin-binding protein [Caulobacteraceae bacterium]|nr:PBP1A family penicillin-binding protein [Caulobacteraceae bacterium]